MPQERRKLQDRVREVVQRVCDPRLQETQALDGDGEVVVVARQVFTGFRAAISFSLRDQRAGTSGNGLTVRPVAHAPPETLGEHDALLELVDALAHGQEPLVGLAHTRERVEQRVRDAVEHARGVLRPRRVRDVLVHVDVLRAILMRRAVQIGDAYSPIPLIRKTREGAYFAAEWGAGIIVARSGEDW